MPKVLKRRFILVDIEVNANITEDTLSEWIASAFTIPGRMSLEQIVGCQRLSQLVKTLEDETDFCTPKRVEVWGEYKRGKWSIVVSLPHADDTESHHVISLKPGTKKPGHEWKATLQTYGFKPDPHIAAAFPRYYSDLETAKKSITEWVRQMKERIKNN
jgi:hypothetical protein